jgi:hypothetical protein
MYYWQEHILTELLDEETMYTLIPFLCNTNTLEYSNMTLARTQRVDVITHTITLLLTCPLQLVIMPLGVAFLYGHSSYIFPFHMMSVRHREFVRAVITQHSDEWNIIDEHIVCHRTPGKHDLFIPPLLILTALCKSVFSSQIHRDTRIRVGICNVILQRVQGFIPINKPVQKQLNAWLIEQQNLHCRAHHVDHSAANKADLPQARASQQDA